MLQLVSSEGPGVDLLTAVIMLSIVLLSSRPSDQQRRPTSCAVCSHGCAPDPAPVIMCKLEAGLTRQTARLCKQFLHWPSLVLKKRHPHGQSLSWSCFDTSQEVKYTKPYCTRRRQSEFTLLRGWRMRRPAQFCHSITEPLLASSRA